MTPVMVSGVLLVCVVLQALLGQVFCAATWPTATGTQAVSSTISVSGTYDGALKRFYGSGSLGSSGQDEDQGPIFELKDGATLKNVIIGSPAADGVHCLGKCTIENVWWEDVGEDAATFKGTNANTVCTVKGGGAKKADDKVFQHNGAGELKITNFDVSDFGKLYRSCGNCKKQYRRVVTVDNVYVTAPGKSLVGINTNYQDVATIKNVKVKGDSSKKIKICEKFTGVTSGEPTSIGSGPDSTNCKYTTSDVTYV